MVYEADLDELDLAEQALAAARTVGNVAAEAAAQLVVAKVSREQGKLRDALEAAEAALDLSRAAGNGHGEVAALVEISRVSLAKENTRKALKVSEKALAIATSLADVGAQLEAMDAMATTYLARREVQPTIKVAREMQAIYKKQGNKGGEALALTLMYQAHIAAGLGHEAMRVAYETMVIYRDVGDRRRQLNVLQTLSQLLLEQKMVQEALEMSRDALAIAQELQLRQAEGAALFNVAKANLASPEGLQAAARAARLFQALDLRKEQALALHAVANGYLVQKISAKEALSASAEALGIFKELEDRHGEAIMLHTIANCQLALRETDKSVATAYEALFLFETDGDTYGASLARKLLAGVGQSEGLIRQRLAQLHQSGKFDGVESRGPADNAEETRQRVEELKAMEEEQVLWEVAWVPLETQDPKHYGGDKHVGSRKVMVVGQLRDRSLLRKLSVCRSAKAKSVGATYLYNLLNGRFVSLPSFQAAMRMSECTAAVYDVTMLNNLGPLEVIDVALRLVQAIQTIEEIKVALDIITESAQALALASSVREPVHAPLWGFARTARMENPMNEFRCLDIDAGRRLQNLAFICRYLLGAQGTRPTEAVLRGGMLQVSRIVGSRTRLRLGAKMLLDRNR